MVWHKVRNACVWTRCQSWLCFLLWVLLFRLSFLVHVQSFNQFQIKSIWVWLLIVEKGLSFVTLILMKPYHICMVLQARLSYCWLHLSWEMWRKRWIPISCGPWWISSMAIIKTQTLLNIWTCCYSSLEQWKWSWPVSLYSFPSLFSDTPSHTNLSEHDIDAGDAEPIQQWFYHASPIKQHHLELEVKYMLKNNIAVPKCYSWASPWVLVIKTDQTFQPYKGWKQYFGIV